MTGPRRRKSRVCQSTRAPDHSFVPSISALLSILVRRAAYLLIDAEGVRPVTPVQLKGTASFDFDQGMTAVMYRTVTGTVVGKPSHAVTTAAFVVVGKPGDVKDAHPRAKFEKRKQAGPAVYDFSDSAAP